jgi:SAM-dependent methyltransferase
VIFRLMSFLKRRKYDILSAKDNQIISAFVQDQIEKPRTFNAAISKQDEMYLFALKHFNGDTNRACVELLTTGKQSMDVVRQIIQWNFKCFDNLSNFLDFASGYGRLTRFLIQELSPHHIWVCDIYEDAVKFQQKQFGVEGLVSARNPENFIVDKKFDCIFVASLFSHLPKKQFISWLKRLYELLSPKGLLIFSVHDVSVLPAHLKMGEEGMLFIPESESRSLDMKDYGTTYVTESFIGKVIKEVSGRSSYYRKKRGLWWFQDIYVVQKDFDQGLEKLKLQPGPAGYVENCVVTDNNEIRFDGWAADFGENTSVKDIQIIVDGVAVQRCLPSLDRPDVAAAFQDEKGLKSGFSCSIPRSILRLSDIVIIKVTNSKHIEHVIRIGTIDSLLHNYRSLR